MLDALGPAQVADVHQPVDAIFDFNEGAKVGQVADPAFHDSSCGIALGKMFPGILEQLLHAQRNTTVAGIDAENDGLDFVARLDQLRGMLHPLGPGHLGDVHQPLNALLQLNKRAVVGHAEHPATYPGANGIALDGVEPGIRRELLEAQGNTLLITIELENLDLDLVTDVYKIAPVDKPPPGHIRNIQQAMQAPQVS